MGSHRHAVVHVRVYSCGCTAHRCGHQGGAVDDGAVDGGAVGHHIPHNRHLRYSALATGGDAEVLVGRDVRGGRRHPDGHGLRARPVAVPERAGARDARVLPGSRAGAPPHLALAERKVLRIILRLSLGRPGEAARCGSLQGPGTRRPHARPPPPPGPAAELLQESGSSADDHPREQEPVLGRPPGCAPSPAAARESGGEEPLVPGLGGRLPPRLPGADLARVPRPPAAAELHQVPVPRRAEVQQRAPEGPGTQEPLQDPEARHGGAFSGAVPPPRRAGTQKSFEDPGADPRRRTSQEPARLPGPVDPLQVPGGISGARVLGGGRAAGGPSGIQPLEKSQDILDPERPGGSRGALLGPRSQPGSCSGQELHL
ncbi:collagen alpha-1(III) chain isoform X2 [Penaeus vannamei]|uniref:collagen alpha-1(III) chain isoform X2 n=1 Tax=Penaeus vannamei TaxID=6689 RepID=UPI00387FA29A